MDKELIIEKLNAENELKTKWLSLIAHDFKGMFSNINQLIKLYEDEAISQEVLLRMLPEIKQDAEKNLKTLESTFSWINAQTDSFKPQLENISIYQLYHYLKQALNSEVQTKEITLRFLGDEHLSLCSDRFLLTFILKQTLQNAIKYSNKCGVVRVIVHEQSQYICIEVKDDGLGMKQNELDTLFTLNGSPYKGTLGEKGAGLSMTIVKYFVDMLNAQIKVTSSVDEGTSVMFYFDRKS